MKQKRKNIFVEKPLVLGDVVEQAYALLMPGETVSPETAVMREIAVINDVLSITRKMWAWGIGATRDTTLRGVIAGYGNWRCASIPRQFAVISYIGARVEGSLDQDLSETNREELREAVIECIRAAVADEKQVRARQKNIFELPRTTGKL